MSNQVAGVDHRIDPNHPFIRQRAAMAGMTDSPAERPQPAPPPAPPRPHSQPLPYENGPVGPVGKMPVIGRVKLEFDVAGADPTTGFVLEFDVVRVGINEYTVAIALDTNFNFVPRNMTDYLLTWDGKTYPVQFLVAPVNLFDVPVIQFLRKQ